ncbi:DUF4239 domain-containing protein [Ochrobactrum sp. CGA5]|uniref:bestrophin-like domain n=1 Tax=Ochrobactrum sp. CGA5 TaxID=2583453 RepID=UPI00111FEAE7|nr:DUF4239 domain-containing protein [Ochrobactrum sp. CGA5]
MTYIFELPTYLSFMAFAVLGIVFYAVGRFALDMLSKHAANDVLSIPIGAFISTIATAWALSLGFVAADIWSVNSRADQAISEERSAISRLIGTSKTEILNAPKLTAALTGYRLAVINDEWREKINVEPAGSVETALQNIRREIINLARSDVPSPVISQLINDFDELQDARNTRLAVGSTSIDYYKWYLVLSLTFLTAITIAATHADRVRAGVKALVIYSLTASFCLWILAIHANPYQGLERLEPSLLFTSHKRS